MRGQRLLFLTSWIILLVVSIAIVLISAQSLWVAYSSGADGLTPEYTLTQIQEHGGEQAVKAFRGRRVTAATWALAYGLLAVGVVLAPYRRGEKWAWWLLLISLGLSQLLSLGRAVTIATITGTGAPSILLAFLLLGLLAGTPRIFRPRIEGLDT
jgi:phosphatidylglycerophosphate synthase